MTDSLGQPVYTVTQVTEEISEALTEEFSKVSVEGEISGWKVASSGHAYFALKDENALLKCVMWRSKVSRMRELPGEGALVRAVGGLTVYAPRGEYQLDVQRMTQAGAGLLQQKFEELKRKLEAEGLFESGRKRALPFHIRKVAVITSPTGAAVRDFLRTLENAGVPLDILILPVRVQGLEAADEIAEALAKPDRLGCDLTVVTRGGGSLEDLWSFNEEAVARAIADSPVPVLSAVGHEVDFTIADFVADLRVATPTAAAQELVSRVDALFEGVESLSERLAEAAREDLENRRNELALAKGRLVSRSPLAWVPHYRQRVDDLVARGGGRTRAAIERTRMRIEEGRGRVGSAFRRIDLDWRSRVRGLAGKLEALAPGATLSRGFSLCETAEEARPVVRLKDVPEAGNVRVHLADGAFEASPQGPGEGNA